MYEEYSNIIPSNFIDALKYLEAKRDYSQAVEQDVVDVDNIEANLKLLYEAARDGKLDEFIKLLSTGAGTRFKDMVS